MHARDGQGRAVIARALLCAMVFAAAAIGPAAAEDAFFAGKTLKIIVGMPPGGGVDAYAPLVLRHLFGVKLKQVQGYAGSADKRLALEKGEIDGDCGGFTSLSEEALRSGKITIVLRLSPTLLAGLDASVPFGGDLVGNARDRK